MRLQERSPRRSHSKAPCRAEAGTVRSCGRGKRQRSGRAAGGALTEAGATQQTIRIVTTASTHARTGVAREALTAASVAALTVIDMGKAIDKAIVVRSLRLLEKRGGRSGTFIADAKA